MTSRAASVPPSINPSSGKFSLARTVSARARRRRFAVDFIATAWWVRTAAAVSLAAPRGVGIGALGTSTRGDLANDDVAEVELDVVAAPSVPGGAVGSK